MLKKMKKAFTITELVIVIAVIAILAAVLIPTFTTVVNNANESAAMQEAKSEYDNFNLEVLTSDSQANNDFILKYTKGDKTYYFVVDNGQFQVDPLKDADVELSGDVITYQSATYNKLADDTNDYNDYKEQNSNIIIFAKAA